ncbi:hypothetical protein [Thiomicrorhabdus sp.]|uniref:hypothetical protein n=1 Tax=Thiomicrorhabdus sp. TaxID=2039724 RepID=UPI00356209DE
MMILTWIKTNLKWLAVIAVTIALTYIGFKLVELGRSQAELECQIEKTEAVARAISQTNQINQENAQIAEDYWKEITEQKPKIQTIEKRIIEYVKSNDTGRCDLDDGELHILTDIVDIVNHGSTGTGH